MTTETHGATSMNRIDRLTAIILLLQGGRRTASEIARRFEVPKRTTFRDIQALCEIGVPIVTESGAHGGYTLMPDTLSAPIDAARGPSATPGARQHIPTCRCSLWGISCVKFVIGEQSVTQRRSI